MLNKAVELPLPSSSVFTYFLRDSVSFDTGGAFCSHLCYHIAPVVTTTLIPYFISLCQNAFRNSWDKLSLGDWIPQIQESKMGLLVEAKGLPEFSVTTWRDMQMFGLAPLIFSHAPRHHLKYRTNVPKHHLKQPVNEGHTEFLGAARL